MDIISYILNDQGELEDQKKKKVENLAKYEFQAKEGLVPLLLKTLVSTECFGEHELVRRLLSNKKQTFVANSTVVVSSFSVFLQVVRHVGSSEKLATNFAGDFVFVASEM